MMNWITNPEFKRLAIEWRLAKERNDQTGATAAWKKMVELMTRIYVGGFR